MPSIEIIQNEVFYRISKSDNLTDGRYIRKAIEDIAFVAGTMPHQMSLDEERLTRYARSFNRILADRFQKQDVSEVFYYSKTRLLEKIERNKEARKTVEAQRTKQGDSEVDRCLAALDDAAKSMRTMIDTLDELQWMHK